MALKFSYQPYTLDFKFEAGTSRGVLTEKKTYFVTVHDDLHPELIGIGECGPLVKLSIDDTKDFELHVSERCSSLTGITLPKTQDEIFQLVASKIPSTLPAIRFGMEMALLDHLHGGKRIVFDNEFVKGQPIPINGLIWMGHSESMLLQINEKVDQKFNCIKLKIGSLDFDKECDVLEYVRNKYYAKDIILRVDANGAFKADQALNKLHKLSTFQLHSIEQPIATGQHEVMRSLCANTPVPIALDEELIGVNTYEEKRKMLEYIMPQYIILKPTLLGGFKSSMEWVEIAEELNIGWWLTSALESNIGLNAICQFSQHLTAKGYQGLGTGKLYHNNIDSPLNISNGQIAYDQHLTWDLSFLNDKI